MLFFYSWSFESPHLLRLPFLTDECVPVVDALVLNTLAMTSPSTETNSYTSLISVESEGSAEGCSQWLLLREHKHGVLFSEPDLSLNQLNKHGTAIGFSWTTGLEPTRTGLTFKTDKRTNEFHNCVLCLITSEHF